VENNLDGRFKKELLDTCTNPVRIVVIRTGVPALTKPYRVAFISVESFPLHNTVEVPVAN
jgi:hypothetical protein